MSVTTTSSVELEVSVITLRITLEEPEEPFRLHDVSLEFKGLENLLFVLALTTLPRPFDERHSPQQGGDRRKGVLEISDWAWEGAQRGIDNIRVKSVNYNSPMVIHLEMIPVFVAGAATVVGSFALLVRRLTKAVDHVSDSRDKVNKSRKLQQEARERQSDADLHIARNTLEQDRIALQRAAYSAIHNQLFEADPRVQGYRIKGEIQAAEMLAKIVRLDVEGLPPGEAS